MKIKSPKLERILEKMFFLFSFSIETSDAKDEVSSINCLFHSIPSNWNQYISLINLNSNRLNRWILHTDFSQAKSTKLEFNEAIRTQISKPKAKELASKRKRRRGSHLKYLTSITFIVKNSKHEKREYFKNQNKICKNFPIKIMMVVLVVFFYTSTKYLTVHCIRLFSICFLTLFRCLCLSHSSFRMHLQVCKVVFLCNGVALFLV